MARTQQIKDTLFNSGVSPKLNGFSYLVDAIEICCDNPDVRRYPTGQLYSKIAEKYQHIDPSVILQAIRRAIQTDWKATNEYRDSIFGNNNRIPSPLEFIARLSDVVMKQEEL